MDKDKKDLSRSGIANTNTNTGTNAERDKDVNRTLKSKNSAANRDKDDTTI